MLMVDRVSLTLLNNADWKQPFVAYNYDPNTNVRTPHDLTGSHIRMQIKSAAVGGLAVLDLTDEGGQIVIASLPSTGWFVVYVPAATMWTIPAGEYVGDALVFDPDGSVKPLFQLEIEIDQGDTPPTPT